MSIAATPLRLDIMLDDLSAAPGVRWRGLFVGGKHRFATITSVRLINKHQLVCFSLLGRKAYLIEFNIGTDSWKVLDCIDTTYEGEPCETDLCDADGNGIVVTSNCGRGSASLYQIMGNRLNHLRDLPFGCGYVHGVTFMNPETLAISVLNKEPGVHFYHTATMEKLLSIPMPYRIKDVCFLSENRLVMIGVHGAPQKEAQSIYHSEIISMDFDLAARTYRKSAQFSLSNDQLDSCVVHNGTLHITGGFSDKVYRFDAETLEPMVDLNGYDCPHGIDIGYGLIAVSNYGNTSIILTQL